MKRSFYLYLFLFAALIALIIYVNGRNIQEAQDKAYITLEEKLADKEEQILKLQSQATENIAFSLTNNQEASNYFEASGLDIDAIEGKLFDHLLELNLQEGGNPLIPYVGAGKGFHVSDLQVLNHKWLIANFTDNEIWGEVLIQYDFDENKKLSMQTLKALLYNKYR